MPDHFDSPGKNFIRREWCKPLLSELKKRLNSGMIYMGLPSPDAADIHEWIEVIDKVYAFQCRKYPEPSDPSQDRTAVNQLEARLNELERQSKIKDFKVFDGYIEEVVLRGVDNSDLSFDIPDAISIYNLDFCNSITSPINFKDKKGKPKRAYKFDAIKELLSIQSRVNSTYKKFVMFLTIKSGYDGKELDEYVNKAHKNIKQYFNTLNILPIGDKKSRILRCFVTDTCENFYRHNNFNVEFLPVIKYTGNGNHNLLFFTILGTSNIEASGIAPEIQNLEEFRNFKFITPEENKFILQINKKINENDPLADALQSLKKSKTLKIWSRR